MAAVAISFSRLGEKIARNTQVASQEDAWTVTAAGVGIQGVLNPPGIFLLLRPSVDTYYHTTSGSTASDGFPLLGGCQYPIQLGSSTSFFLRPVSTAGVVDCVIVPASAATAQPFKALTLDASSSLTQGNSGKATYTFSTLIAAPATGNYVVMNFEAGATKTVRLRRLIISNPGSGTALAGLTFELIRTSAASSGGTVKTPAPHDTTAAAFSGIARTDGSTITAGTQITTFTIVEPATVVGSFSPVVFEFYGQMSQAIVVPAGITNGLALRCINGNTGAAGFCASMELTDE